jgi:hypothetical protein
MAPVIPFLFASDQTLLTIDDESAAFRLKRRPEAIGEPGINFPLERVLTAADETAVVDSIARVEVAVFVS